MEQKRRLKIDLDKLCSVIEDNSYEHEYYLDLETGETLFLSEYPDDGERGKLRSRIDDDSDRYERIPKAESHKGYEDLQASITTVDDERLAGLLRVAINGKGVFRRFKDVLLNYPRGKGEAVSVPG